MLNWIPLCQHQRTSAKNHSLEPPKDVVIRLTTACCVTNLVYGRVADNLDTILPPIHKYGFGWKFPRLRLIECGRWHAPPQFVEVVQKESHLAEYVNDSDLLPADDMFCIALVLIADVFDQVTRRL